MHFIANDIPYIKARATKPERKFLSIFRPVGSDVRD
jgi:hypothetical protein